MSNKASKKTSKSTPVTSEPALPEAEETPPAEEVATVGGTVPVESAESAHGTESVAEENKRQFRAALDRKKGNAGTTSASHSDTGGGPHASAGGPTHRMFRRKAGG